MFFTEEDYRKIEKWLVSKGVMDTQFSSAAPLDGNETVAIVQNGKNVNTTIDALVKNLFLLGVDDFLNVTDKYEQPAIPLIQAISLIPFRHRRIGQVITFLNEDNKWVIYQFQGSALTQWDNPTQWVNVIGSAITEELVPDEEDLTGIKEEDKTVLKFKNKAYNTANFSGLGRVYLRKNISDGKNVLTQQMINQENTRYILQYDYDLNGQTITIPNNCVIEFEEGSIANGTLAGNNTYLITGQYYTFRDGLVFSGTFTNESISLCNFGAISNEYSQTALYNINFKFENDISAQLQRAVDSGFNVEFPSGAFYLANTVTISKPINIKLTGSDYGGVDKTLKILTNSTTVIYTDKSITLFNICADSVILNGGIIYCRDVLSSSSNKLIAFNFDGDYNNWGSNINTNILFNRQSLNSIAYNIDLYGKQQKAGYVSYLTLSGFVEGPEYGIKVTPALKTNGTITYKESWYSSITCNFDSVGCRVVHEIVGGEHVIISGKHQSSNLFSDSEIHSATILTGTSDIIINAKYWDVTNTGAWGNAIIVKELANYADYYYVKSYTKFVDVNTNDLLIYPTILPNYCFNGGLRRITRTSDIQHINVPTDYGSSSVDLDYYANNSLINVDLSSGYKIELLKEDLTTASSNILMPSVASLFTLPAITQITYNNLPESSTDCIKISLPNVWLRQSKLVVTQLITNTNFRIWFKEIVVSNLTDTKQFVLDFNDIPDTTAKITKILDINANDYGFYILLKGIQSGVPVSGSNTIDLFSLCILSPLINNSSKQRIKYGSTTVLEANRTSLGNGDTCYDTTAESIVTKSGTSYVNAFGYKPYKVKSATRPDSLDAGSFMFDTSINKSILWDGTNWLNSDGTLTSKVVII